MPISNPGTSFDPASPGPLGGTAPAALSCTQLTASTGGNQHTLTSTASGAVTFSTANVAAVRHTSADGASAFAFLRHTDGAEIGAVGYKNNGAATYLNEAVYLAGGIYNPDGTPGSATPPKVIIGQEANGNGFARILLDTDWSLHFKTSTGATHSIVGPSGGWHLNSTGAVPATSTLDAIGTVMAGADTDQTQRNLLASGWAICASHSSGSLLRLVRANVGKMDVQYNGTGATRRIDFIDTDNGSLVPLSLSMAGTGAISLGGPAFLKSFTVATLPAATEAGVIYVSDETGGATLALADGTNWRRAQDRAIVS